MAVLLLEQLHDRLGHAGGAHRVLAGHEAAVLDDLRLAFFDDLEVPLEEEPVPVLRQAGFSGAGFEEEGEDDEPGEDEEA